MASSRRLWANCFINSPAHCGAQAAYSEYWHIDREVAVVNKTDETVRIAWNQLINGREREELLASAAGISYDVMQNRKRLRDAGCAGTDRGEVCLARKALVA
ncbi:hypothetical protein [Noviherbaspirillum sedimenti]|nr:hypothetical protein [Noviherbaspirillum sedimenti]